MTVLSKTVSPFKRILLCTSLIASLGAVSLPVSAAVEHIVDNGILIGANNVDVGGSKYDVRFVDGTFNNIFGTNALTFNTQAAATSASNALLQTVFINITAGNFDDFPLLTAGCGFDSLCGVITPRGVSGDDVLASSALNWGKDNEAVFKDNAEPMSFGVFYNSARDDAYVYAVWTPSSVAAVPEPTTYAMMGLGLLGVMGMARRRQYQA